MVEQMSSRQTKITHFAPTQSSVPSQLPVTSRPGSSTNIAGPVTTPLSLADLPSKQNQTVPPNTPLFVPTTLVVFAVKTDGIKASTGSSFAKKVGIQEFSIAATATMEGMILFTTPYDLLTVFLRRACS